MKRTYLTPFALLASIGICSLSGCGEPKAASMAEGIELSDIEAYEKAQKEMEAESMRENDESGKNP